MNVFSNRNFLYMDIGYFEDDGTSRISDNFFFFAKMTIFYCIIIDTLVKPNILMGNLTRIVIYPRV